MALRLNQLFVWTGAWIVSVHIENHAAFTVANQPLIPGYGSAGQTNGTPSSPGPMGVLAGDVPKRIYVEKYKISGCC